MSDRQNAEITPFRPVVPDHEINDLRERLSRARLPEPETAPGWAQGIPLDYLTELIRYWRDEHDWRRVEGELASHGQSHTILDGLGVHFLHIRSSRPDARPLLITHGWPGSVIETLDVIDALAEPCDGEPAFHLVIPSLPGFGYSQKPAEAGWGIERIADAWVALMTRLGYERFFVQGGDWGAMVTITIAVRHPERVAMMHTTVPWAPRPEGFDDNTLTPTEKRWLEEYAEFGRSGRGYALQQSTRPQTIGYALVDSPTAQLAWIAEKFFDFSDSETNPEEAVSRDRILDDVSLYWFTRTGASAARLYWESFRGLGMSDTNTPVTVPAAVTVFPRDLQKLPRSWVEERYRDLRHWSVAEHGGHFPMLEVPEAFCAEIRTAFANAPA
ncbi:epoxide hydrolase family protein [Actinoallomurus sp. CA-142502]|uniref:epoxide hydrolase family protein n=1 Tax=Actinoallomurus sp. CA-142502 TaxID=3239885 RepID=UPI003D9454C2